MHLLGGLWWQCDHHPFCLQDRRQSLREALNNYHAVAYGQRYTDVSLHLIITNPTAAVLGQEMPSLIAAGYGSLKVFMTHESRCLNDGEILNALDVPRETGATVMVTAKTKPRSGS